MKNHDSMHFSVVCANLDCARSAESGRDGAADPTNNAASVAAA
jgi:hypothetical protein